MRAARKAAGRGDATRSSALASVGESDAPVSALHDWARKAAAALGWETRSSISAAAGRGGKGAAGRERSGASSGATAAPRAVGLTVVPGRPMHQQEVVTAGFDLPPMPSDPSDLALVEAGVVRIIAALLLSVASTGASSVASHVTFQGSAEREQSADLLVEFADIMAGTATDDGDGENISATERLPPLRRHLRGSERVGDAVADAGDVAAAALFSLAEVVAHAARPLVGPVVSHLEAVYLRGEHGDRAAAVTATTAFVLEDPKSFVDGDDDTVIWGLHAALDASCSSDEAAGVSASAGGARRALIRSFGLLAPLFAAADFDLTRKVVGRLLSIPRATAGELRAAADTLVSLFQAAALGGAKVTVSAVLPAMITALSSEHEWNNQLLAGAIAVSVIAAFHDSKHPEPSIDAELSVVAARAFKAETSGETKGESKGGATSAAMRQSHAKLRFLLWRAQESRKLAGVSVVPFEKVKKPPRDVVVFAGEVIQHHRSPSSVMRAGVAQYLRGLLHVYGFSIVKTVPAIEAVLLLGCLDTDAAVVEVSRAALNLAAIASGNRQLQRELHGREMHWVTPLVAVDSGDVVPDFVRTAALTSPAAPLDVVKPVAASLPHVSFNQRMRLLGLLKAWAPKLTVVDMEVLAPLLNLIVPLAPGALNVAPQRLSVSDDSSSQSSTRGRAAAVKVASRRDRAVSCLAADVLCHLGPALSAARVGDMPRAVSQYLFRALQEASIGKDEHLLVTLLDTAAVVMEELPAADFAFWLLPLCFRGSQPVRLSLFRLIGRSEAMWKANQAAFAAAASLLILGLGDRDRDCRRVAIASLLKMPDTSGRKAIVDCITAAEAKIVHEPLPQQIGVLNSIAEVIAVAQGRTLCAALGATLTSDEFAHVIAHELETAESDNSDQVSCPLVLTMLYSKVGKWVEDTGPLKAFSLQERYLASADDRVALAAALSMCYSVVKAGQIVPSNLQHLSDALISYVTTDGGGGTGRRVASASLSLSDPGALATKRAGALLVATRLVLLRAKGLNAHFVDNLVEPAINYARDYDSPRRLRLAAIEFLQLLMVVRPRHVAATSLVQLRDALRELIVSDDATLRQRAAQAYPRVFRIVQFTDTEVIEEFQAYLRNDLEPLRAGTSKWERAADPLLAFLAPEQLQLLTHVSLNAIAALPKSVAIGAMGDAVTMMRHSDADIRAHAVRALLELGERVSDADRVFALWVSLPLSMDPAKVVRDVYAEVRGPDYQCRLDVEEDNVTPDGDDATIGTSEPARTRFMAMPTTVNADLIDYSALPKDGGSTVRLPRDDDAEGDDDEEVVRGSKPAKPTSFDSGTMDHLRKLASAFGPVNSAKLDLAQFHLQGLSAVPGLEGPCALVLALLIVMSDAVGDETRTGGLVRRLLADVAVDLNSEVEARVLGSVLALRALAEQAPALTLSEAVATAVEPTRVCNGTLLALKAVMSGVCAQEKLVTHLSQNRAVAVCDRLLAVIGDPAYDGDTSSRALALELLGEITDAMPIDRLPLVVESIVAVLEGSSDSEMHVIAGQQLSRISSALPEEHPLTVAIVGQVEEAIRSPVFSTRQRAVTLFTVFSSAMPASLVRNHTIRLLADPAPSVRARALTWALDPNQSRDIGSILLPRARDIVTAALASGEINEDDEFEGPGIVVSERPRSVTDDGAAAAASPDGVSVVSDLLEIPLKDDDPLNAQYLASHYYRSNAVSFGIEPLAARPTVVGTAQSMYAWLLPQTDSEGAAAETRAAEAKARADAVELAGRLATVRDTSALGKELVASDGKHGQGLLFDLTAALARLEVLLSKETLQDPENDDEIEWVRHNCSTLTAALAAFDGTRDEVVAMFGHLRDKITALNARCGELRTAAFDAMDSITFMAWHSMQLPVTSLAMHERAQEELRDIDECATDVHKREAREKRHAALLKELRLLHTSLWRLTDLTQVLVHGVSRLVITCTVLKSEAIASSKFLFALVLTATHRGVRAIATRGLVRVAKRRTGQVGSLVDDIVLEAAARLEIERMPDQTDAVIRELSQRAEAVDDGSGAGAGAVAALDSLSAKLYRAKADVVVLLGHLLPISSSSQLRCLSLLHLISCWDDRDSHVSRAAITMTEHLARERQSELLEVMGAGPGVSDRRQAAIRSPLVSAIKRRVAHKQFRQKDALSRLLMYVMSSARDA